ncbi:MobH family relaxase [Thiocystis violascens]|uniref:Putative helicase n=1 Tax=Thiocystis violascens (strain ATCC 17096 / DSM 198 / 6111) TaxID=765911 RepID=I3Y949_THIV6|nr:MobH family relaxase [Thiocystis violascens]AFL73517.1 Putative helicase [Thiocystis violascens DSM 198]
MPSLMTRYRAAWAAFRTADVESPSNGPSASAAPADLDPAQEIPRYPPFLKGLPVASTAQILATQQALIASLQDALAFSDQDYSTLVLPLIELYATFVHLLPASETHHHRGAGGLFRHGLEVAFQAARASRGRLFALDRLPEERRILEPRWHLAACIAGLLHDVGKPVADLSVVDRNGAHRWQPLDETLVEWAGTHGVNRYFLRWNSQRVHHGHELFTAAVLPQILTRPVRHWLMDPDPLVWLTLGRVLAGMDDQALLGELMREADRVSVAQDLRENRLDPDALSLGVPIERYLIDTMRSLLRDGTWTVNTPGARVWIFPPNRVHLVWPACAEAIVQRLSGERIPGIPRDPDTLADILIERHLARARPLGEGVPVARYWRLAPTLLAREQPVELSFLCLASPELLFSGVVPPATPLVTTVPESGLASVVVAEAVDVAPTVTLVSAMVPALDSGHEAEGDAPGAGVQRIAELGRNATPAEPSERDQARDWLRQQGPAGDVLIALSEALSEDRLTADACPSLIQGRVFLPYPQGLAGWDAAPGEILETFVVRDWIERDPLRPMLKVREHEGVSGVWLRRAVSRRLVALGLGAVSVPSRPPETIPPQSVANEATVGDDPPNRTSAKGSPATTATTATKYAQTIRQRLLARDPTLGVITERPGALSIPLRGPILDGARRASVSETALRRALERLPNARPVEKGILTLGL